MAQNSICRLPLNSPLSPYTLFSRKPVKASDTIFSTAKNKTNKFVPRKKHYPNDTKSELLGYLREHAKWNALIGRAIHDFSDKRLSYVTLELKKNGH